MLEGFGERKSNPNPVPVGAAYTYTQDDTSNHMCHKARSVFSHHHHPPVFSLPLGEEWVEGEQCAEGVKLIQE